MFTSTCLSLTAFVTVTLSGEGVLGRLGKIQTGQRARKSEGGVKMTDWSESKKGRGRGQNDRLVREQERQREGSK